MCHMTCQTPRAPDASRLGPGRGPRVRKSKFPRPDNRSRPDAAPRQEGRVVCHMTCQTPRAPDAVRLGLGPGKTRSSPARTISACNRRYGRPAPDAPGLRPGRGHAFKSRRGPPILVAGHGGLRKRIRGACRLHPVRWSLPAARRRRASMREAFSSLLGASASAAGAARSLAFSSARLIICLCLPRPSFSSRAARCSRW